MTDEELRNACAEAMGWQHLGAVGYVPASDRESYQEIEDKANGRLWCRSGGNDWWKDPEGRSVCGPCSGIPDPLTNDADAMALVKRLHLHIDQRPGKQISVQPPHFEEMVCQDAHKGHTLDLNRAICECVAKIRRPPSTQGKQINGATRKVDGGTEHG